MIAAGAAPVAIAPPATAQAPDPGGDPNAVIQLPPAGKEFGYSGLFNTHSADTPALAALAGDGGGNGARMPLQWWGVEAKRDRWEERVWDRHARAYNLFRAAGVRPHFIIGVSPPWARDEGPPQSCLDRATCVYPPARAMLDEWREFAREVAIRFPAATIEIWNEPNSLGQWRSGVDPARYAELLAAAYNTIKGVNAQQHVLMGGLAESVGSGSVALKPFLDGAYAATPTLRGHTDAINFHTYPGTRLGAGSPFAQVLADVRQVRAAHGDETTPLFISETGQTTSGPSAYTEAQQAYAVLRTVRKLLTMSDVSGVLVHTLLDRSEYGADDPEYGFGALSVSATGLLAPKRLYCELSRATGSVYAECPPLARIDAGPIGPVNVADPLFSFSSTEPAAFRCWLDGAAVDPCSNPYRFTGLPEGPHVFAVQAVDALGRADPEPVERRFTVDTLAPDTDLWGPSGAIADSTPRVAPSSPDSSARLECSLDGAPFAACASSVELGPLADGPHTFRARAVDPAGNVDASPASVLFGVDTRNPGLSITAGPQGPTTEGQPVFEFASDESDVRFLCAFNGQSPGPCSTPGSHTTAGILGDGSYSFEVLAIDAAGNRSNTVSRAFEVDRTGPTASIVAAASPTADATPTFELSSAEAPVTYECRFDSNPFEPCLDAVTAAQLVDGYHALEARGLDRLGNRGLIARNVFVVDTRAPSVWFTAAPSSLINVTSATFEFKADESSATFQCSLNGATYSRCLSPSRLTGLGDGAQVMRVRGIDAAGNVGSPVRRDFTVDTVGPVVTIESGVDGPTAQLRPSYSFSSESGAGFQCRFDQQAFGACSAPSSHQPATALAEGAHRFEVRATDRAGNLSGTSSRSLIVDRTAPEPPAIVLENARNGGWVASQNIDVVLGSAEPGARFECVADVGPLGPCAPSQSLGPLAEGPRVIYARVTDPAGNVSGIASARATIDLTAPDSQARVVRGSLRDAKRFALTANEAEATFRCKLDREPYRRCAASYRPAGISPGRHSLRVRATDRAGNPDPTPHRLRFRTR